jgi:hypothetical protein
MERTKPRAMATGPGRSPSETAFAAWSLLALACTALVPGLWVLPSLVEGRDLLDYYGGQWGLAWLVQVFLVPILAGLAMLGVLASSRARRAWPTVTGLAFGAAGGALVLWGWSVRFAGQVWPT